MSKPSPTDVILVLGDQLFSPGHFEKIDCHTIFMAEDRELCTHFKYHKLKLILFLASMRQFSASMTAQGYQVHYEKLSSQQSDSTFESKLSKFASQAKIQRLHVFEINDKFFEERLQNLCKQKKWELVLHENPMFLTPRPLFAEYTNTHKKPFMKTFYEGQRRRLKLLIDAQGKPEGGQWSFDKDNRARLPKTVVPPLLPTVEQGPEVTAVIRLVEEQFPDHPGEGKNFWMPTTHRQAKQWLQTFLTDRFKDFGAYEDAISQKHDFIFHSVLTPLLNTGLITPAEVVEAVLAYRRKKNIPLNSVEGFIRQIIGWREFINGIYRTKSEKQECTNFWKHTGKLKPCWYDGTTGIDPIDYVLKKVVRLGYCHHIERLMILGNLMLLCEIEPQQAHAWFMEMFVDSADWVMGPNVYGMGIFSDGGIFATKPYLCASNYLLKMSDFKRGAWCDDVDALFWTFLGKHSTFFAKNPRLNMLVKNWEKRDPAEIKKLKEHAQSVRKRLTD